MPTRASITIEDHEGQISTMSFWVTDLSALNYGSVTQDVDEIKDAVAPLIEGKIRKVDITKTFPETFDPVNNPLAQVEAKWLVTFRDTTQFLDAANSIANPGYGKLFTMEVPTAKLTLKPATSLDQPSAGDIDYADTDVVAFIAAFEANVRSPYNTSAVAPTVDVISIVNVGRN